MWHAGHACVVLLTIVLTSLCTGLSHPGGSPDAALIYNPGSMTLEGACEVQR